jgi:hypothetical protein
MARTWPGSPISKEKYLDLYRESLVKLIEQGFVLPGEGGAILRYAGAASGQHRQLHHAPQLCFFAVVIRVRES